MNEEQIIKELEKNRLKQQETKDRLIRAVKDMACYCCDKISVDFMESRTRKNQAVFARYLVVWFLHKRMKMNITHSGKTVNLDHATSLYGLRIVERFFNGEQKYMKKNHVLYFENWYKSFESIIK